MLTALYRNDRRLCDSITDDTLFDFVVAVTADSYPAEGHPLTADRVVEEIAAWIKSSSEKIAGRGGSMKVADFVKRCADAGANVKHVKGGAISISNGRRGSIRISRSTPEISGPVVRTYLRRLGMSPSKSGFDLKEFEEGVNPEREQVHRFIVTLRRLAKT